MLTFQALHMFTQNLYNSYEYTPTYTQTSLYTLITMRWALQYTQYMYVTYAL